MERRHIVHAKGGILEEVIRVVFNVEARRKWWQIELSRMPFVEELLHSRVNRSLLVDEVALLK